MNPSIKTYLLLVAFFCFVSLGTSTKCYHYTCEDNCPVADEPRATHLRTIVDCAPGEHCAVSRPYLHSGTIFRGCNDDKKYCDTHHPDVYMCYTCNEDLCNDV